MHISQKTEKNIPVMLLSGKISSLAVNDLHQAIHPVLQTSPSLVLNFKDVQSIGSSGVGFMVSMHQEFQKQHGSFMLCEVPPSVLWLFHATGVDSVLNIYPTERSAISQILDPIRNLMTTSRSPVFAS